MKGLVGKKLGMTQLFDEESGGVTPVTVIEAGPCPVVAVRTPDADGYEAVQLAWEPVADRKISKAERGHLAKAGVDGAYRHLVEFRGHFADAVQGENVTVEIFQPGDKVKVSGTGIGKGFQGTIKRHNFHRGPVTHGSHNVRKPGSIGASATPSRVFKGMKMAGRMGGKRATQVGLTVHSVDAERNLLLVKGAVPGPEERARRDPRGRALMAAPKAPVLGGAKKEVSLDEAVFGADIKPHLVHEAVRAELNARRQGTRAAKSRGLVAGGRAKPWRQKGTGRARQGTIRAPQFAGGGVAFPPDPARLLAQGEQEGRARRAARRAQRPRPGRDARPRRRRLVRGAVDEAGRRAAAGLGPGGRRRCVVATEDEETLIKSFRNLPRVLVTVPAELEVAHVVWARSLVVSEAALPLVQKGRAS